MLPWNLVRIVNPNGGVVYGRAVEEQFLNEQLLERILITRIRPGNLDETPCADPHAGCCGEGGRETRPYSIGIFYKFQYCYAFN
ncbi:MAG: hypothetical protein GY705_02255 [Bacteroidetes bacterium]|nr:hypothetical protein [Bacteroidota bacterium]